MNQNKYLKSIGKRLMCGHVKKKEILKQIASDLSIAMESGKTFEEAMAEMGSPKEAAAEFNENFDEAERKLGKRQKYFRIAGAVVCVLIVLAAAVFWFLPKAALISENSVFSEEEVIAKAKEVIAVLDENDMETLQPLMTEVMQKFLTEKVLLETKAMLSEEFGAFQSWGSAYVVEVEQAGQKMAVIEIVANYENVTVIYQLSFDTNMKLSGLYLR